VNYHPETEQQFEPLAYSIENACRVSSLGRTNIYRLIKEGKLEVTKIGGRTLVKADSLRRLIKVA
jgi:excisionase family DNA binding protein